MDCTGHRARMREEGHRRDADLALTMEDGHAEALRAEFPDQADKVYMLTEMIGRSYNIADPYGGPLVEYERMAAEVARVIDAGLDRIVALAGENANTRAPSEGLWWGPGASLVWSTPTGGENGGRVGA